MDTLAANDLQMDAPGIGPGTGHDVVVFGSIGMIAAATGLGVFYEAGAAGWLAVTAGSLTALVLSAGHLGLTAPQSPPAKRRAMPKEPRAMATPQQANRPATPSPVEGDVKTSNDRASEPATLHARQPMHALPPPKMAEAAPAVPSSPISTAPKARADIELAELEALVRQMAAGVPGAKAVHPDPDRAASVSPASTAPTPVAHEARHTTPSLRVGFGAPAVAADVGARVATAIAEARVNVLLAPIQSLTEQRASHFEVIMRLCDESGEALADSEVAEVARATGLAGAIDALKLPRVARVARKVQGRGGAPADVLAGVFGDSLTDKAFIDALDAAMGGPTPPPVVLSFTQADVRAFGRVHWWALATLADIGLHFAIADLTDLDMDFDLLAARGFTFAKLDADVFLNGLPHGASVIPAADLTRHLSTVGLQIIVASIAAQDQMDRITACGVSLGQGALFGEPKPVRRDILEG